MRILKLPSGAELRISISGIRECLELQDAFVEALKEVNIDPKNFGINLRKELLCALLPNKRLRAAIEVCMRKSLYNGLHIEVEKTFEPIEARDDLYTVYTTVAEENLLPFVKSLSAELKAILDLVQGGRKSQSETTPTSSSSDSPKPDMVAS